MPTSEVLIETLEAAGCEVTRNSGRGMFGRECVTVKNEPAWSVARGLPCRNGYSRTQPGRSWPWHRC